MSCESGGLESNPPSYKTAILDVVAYPTGKEKLLWSTVQ